MRNCRVSKLSIALVLLTAAVLGPAGASFADPVNLTLTRTNPLVAVSDTAGSTLYESGTMALAGNIVGRFVRTIRTVTGATDAQNTGLVTITLLALGPAPPVNVTLVGSHDFSSGDDIGGISAASIAGLAGATWSLKTVSASLYTLTLNL